MIRPVTRLVTFAVVALGAFAAVQAAAAATRREVPIAVEVGDHLDRHRSFLDRITSEPTDSSERDVERSLRGRPWLDLVARDGEVTIDVTRRYVSESSRAKPKDGKLSVTWRYLVRAMIRMRDERDALEATATSSETLTESEANRTRSETYRDASTFERLGRELAEQANNWILARLDALRPERPDAGFRHEVKHKWLVKGDGLQVTEVLPGSPAALAGLAVGDRIRAIDLEKGTTEMDLRARTWWFEPPGTRVRLEVERDKARRELDCEVLPPLQWAGPPAAGEHAGSGQREEEGRPEGTRVKPGMRPDEVESVLGKPLRAVSFESKTVWTYDGFRVVFVDGQVSDVQ